MTDHSMRHSSVGFYQHIPVWAYSQICSQWCHVKTDSFVFLHSHVETLSCAMPNSSYIHFFVSDIQHTSRYNKVVRGGLLLEKSDSERSTKSRPERYSIFNWGFDHVNLFKPVSVNRIASLLVMPQCFVVPWVSVWNSRVTWVCLWLSDSYKTGTSLFAAICKDVLKTVVWKRLTSRIRTYPYEKYTFTWRNDDEELCVPPACFSSDILPDLDLWFLL